MLAKKGPQWATAAVLLIISSGCSRTVVFSVSVRDLQTKEPVKDAEVIFSEAVVGPFRQGHVSAHTAEDGTAQIAIRTPYYKNAFLVEVNARPYRRWGFMFPGRDYLKSSTFYTNNDELDIGVTPKYP